MYCIKVKFFNKKNFFDYKIIYNLSKKQIINLIKEIRRANIFKYNIVFLDNANPSIADAICRLNTINITYEILNS